MACFGCLLFSEMENVEISTKKMSATKLKRKQLGSGSVRSLRQKRSKIGALSLSARLTQPNSLGVMKKVDQRKALVPFLRRKSLPGVNA